jgi:mannose-1-phosphate guanylyltransferase/phosphomannomutase
MESPPRQQCIGAPGHQKSVGEMKVVIIAGGKGTRIASVNSEIPKAMIPVGGKPVIEHQVEMARSQGFTRFVFLTGYLGEQIRQYFGDGSRWGVSIEYYCEQTPLGTAGALAEVADLLEDDFFVFYGDTVMDIDMHRMLDFHTKNNADATLFVHPNDHPFDSDIVLLDEKHRVTGFDNKPHADDFVSHNIVNAALFVFNKSVLQCINRGEKSQIEKDVLPRCLQKGLKLYGYTSFEYVKDMGTPERYESVCRDWQNGRVSAMNSFNKQRAVFLDRDGVINQDIGLVYKPEQITLIDGVEDAIRFIHEHGYLAIVITNQSVIARNLCTFKELDTINATMETFLGKKRTYINALYFCPHHPHGGYPEERKEFKIKCDCRKPAPGLLFRAAEDWNIDLSHSIMVGDRDSDVEAGINARVQTSIMVPTNEPGALLDALKRILEP